MKTSIGILGGGQLGRMMILAGYPLNFDFGVLALHENDPCKGLIEKYEIGDFRDKSQVIKFAHNFDIITIEFEDISLEALEILEESGKIIAPGSNALRIIKDKGLQKEFYRQHGFPTAEFKYDYELDLSKIKTPLIQKLRIGGYDGYGVRKIEPNQINSLLEGASIFENLIEIEKEVAVIAARSGSGEIALYDPTELIFDEQTQMLNYLQCPANITPNQHKILKQIAADLINQLEVCGLLAIEFFITSTGQILINECAPRPHNSGHHTIESCITSQFEQHLRAISGLPLGSTQLLKPGIMANIKGTPSKAGNYQFSNLDKILKYSGVHVHLYGKEKSKPGRKMGHCNIMADSIDNAKQIYNQIKPYLYTTTKE